MILPSVFTVVTFLKILVPDRITAVTDNVSLRPLRFDVFLTVHIFRRRTAIIKRSNRFATCVARSSLVSVGVLTA